MRWTVVAIGLLAGIALVALDLANSLGAIGGAVSLGAGGGPLSTAQAGFASPPPVRSCAR